MSSHLPFRWIVSRSLSLSESALALDDEIRTFRRETVGELSLEFVSGALLSILVKPRETAMHRVEALVVLYRSIFVWRWSSDLNSETSLPTLSDRSSLLHFRLNLNCRFLPTVPRCSRSTSSAVHTWSTRATRCPSAGLMPMLGRLSSSRR